jgi:molecular chaperone Hsp33
MAQQDEPAGGRPLGKEHAVSENGPRDELIRTLSSDGSLSVRALVATQLVAEAARRHATAPTATAALGRSLMGAVLLGSGATDDETLQIQLRGDGALGAVTAIADGCGRVRGYVGRPATHLPLRDGKLDVGRAVGKGVLAVVRYHPSWKEPYSGIVPLISGEIAEDLAHYLWESEQIPSALALGVHVNAHGGVAAAGGYLVQALPNAEPLVMDQLTRTVRALAPVSAMVRAGAVADTLIDRLLEGIGARTRERTQPCFQCSCNRQRVERAIALLGRAEAESTLREQGSIEVTCEFCCDRYVLAPEDVRALFE